MNRGTRTWKRTNTLFFKYHAELRLRFFNAPHLVLRFPRGKCQLRDVISCEVIIKIILKNLSLIIAVLISLCSCIDNWVNPISDVRDAKVDKRLIGTWVVKHKEGKSEEVKFIPKEFAEHSMVKKQEEVVKPKETFCHIYEIDEHSMYVYTMNPTDVNAPCAGEHYKIHVSELEGRTFLNLRIYDCSAKELSRYVILEYEFNGENEVSFYHTDDKFVKEVIKNKRLSGEPADYGEEVVTATSPEIREFIKNSPKEKLFDRNDPLVLKRFEKPKVAKKSICILF